MAARRRKSVSENPKRFFSLLGIGLIGMMMLVSHQNCGSRAQMSSFAAAGAAVNPNSDGGLVSIIDESKSVSGLTFAYNEIELSAGVASAQLDGICTPQEQDAILNWSIGELNPDGSLGSVISQGQAQCNNGHYPVPVAVGGLKCGQNYKAISQLGFGKPGEVVFHKPCIN